MKFKLEDLLDAARAEATKNTAKQCSAWRRGFDEHLCDDLAQEFALGALRALEQARNKDGIKTYQWRFGRGSISHQLDRERRYHKRHAREVEVSDVPEPVGGKDPAEIVEAQEERALLVARIKKALAVLTDKERWVIEQRFFAERTLTDIARERKVSVEAVRLMQNRALARMKKFLTAA